MNLGDLNYLRGITEEVQNKNEKCHIILLVLNLQITQTETATAVSVQLMNCVKVREERAYLLLSKIN